MVHLYLADMACFGAANAEYCRHFPVSSPPARAAMSRKAVAATAMSVLRSAGPNSVAANVLQWANGEGALRAAAGLHWHTGVLEERGAQAIVSRKHLKGDASEERER